MDFRIQQMEREFCSDYKCCNIKLSDMHALFAHLETCHSGNTTDNLSFSASDPTNETSFDAPSPFSSTIDSPSGSLSPIDANSSYTSPLSTPEPIFLTSLYPDIQDLQSPLSPTISPASAASHPTVPPPGLDLSTRVQFNCLTSAQTRDKLYVPVSIPSNMRSAAKPPQPATPSQRPVSFIPHATGYGYGFYYLPLMPSSNSLAPVPVATKGPKPLSRQNSVSSLTCIADSEPAATPAARPTTSACHDSLATASSSFLSSCPPTPGPVFPTRQAPIFATPASPSVNVNVNSVSSSSSSQKAATSTHSLAQLRFRFFGGADNGSRWSDPLAAATTAEVTPRRTPLASREVCEECIQPEEGGEVVEAVDARGAGDGGGGHGASGREECVFGATDCEEADGGVRERRAEGVESLVDEVEWANINCGNVSVEDSGGVALASLAASHVSGDQHVVEGDVEDGMESVSPSLPPIDRPLFVNGKYLCPTPHCVKTYSSPAGFRYHMEKGTCTTKHNELIRRARPIKVFVGKTGASEVPPITRNSATSRGWEATPGVRHSTRLASSSPSASGVASPTAAKTVRTPVKAASKNRAKGKVGMKLMVAPRVFSPSTTAASPVLPLDLDVDMVSDDEESLLSDL